MRTIEEKNRIIAEFMGAKTSDGKYFTIPNVVTTTTAQMKYHDSWDWLMPVLEKVRTTDLKGTIMENIYSTYVVFPFTYSTEIYRVYDRIVEFIEWYNENK